MIGQNTLAAGRAGPDPRTLITVQLRVARVCLDCEEVHDGQTCPICASESFAYISRWVPVPERRIKPRPTLSEQAETYQRIINPSVPPTQSLASKLAKGAIGLATITVAGWLWQRITTPGEEVGNGTTYASKHPHAADPNVPPA
jgi:hypothetical protein